MFNACVVESDIDWESQAGTDEGEAGPSTAAVAATTTTTDDDESSDDDDNRVVAALDRAQQLFVFVDVPPKRCHCHCKMGADDGRCIDGFTEQEQQSIRCVLYYIFAD